MRAAESWRELERRLIDDFAFPVVDRHELMDRAANLVKPMRIGHGVVARDQPSE